MSSIDQLLQEIQITTHPAELFDRLFRLGSMYMDSNLLEESREHYLRALSLVPQIEESIDLPGLYANIGTTYSRANDYGSSSEWTRKALELLPDHPHSRHIGRIHFNWANSCADTGDFHSAHYHYEKAIEYYRDSPHQREHAEALNNKGVAYGKTMEYGSAIDCFTRSLAIREAIDDIPGISYSLGNIGATYGYINELDKALEYHERSLQFKRQLSDHRGISGSLCNMGEAHRKLKHYELALQYYKSAEAEAIQHNILTFLPNIFHCLGVLYYQLDKPDEALQYVLRSYEISSSRNDHRSAAMSLVVLGKIYLTPALLHLPTAEHYLHLALRFDEESQTKNYELYEALSGLTALQGDYKLSLEYYQKFHKEKEIALSEDVKKSALAFDIDRKTAEREKHFEIERAERASERKILNNVLPNEITVRLINGENPIADYFESVSILFMDIVDFTSLSTRISVQQLVHLLNSIFTASDAVMREFGLEKIKTIGDAYMAVAGAPVVQADHAQRAARAALQLLDTMKNLVVTFPDTLNRGNELSRLPEIEVRIGLHCGPAAAGVVGESKFLYDMWGDTVNTASRMESHGLPGHIHMSEDFVRALGFSNGENAKTVAKHFAVRPRGAIDIKGKGLMQTYYLEHS